MKTRCNYDDDDDNHLLIFRFYTNITPPSSSLPVIIGDKPVVMVGWEGER